jgi:hypothetical protein
MSAIDRASQFCLSLISHRIRYQMDIVRDEAIMVTLAVPGQLWEVEFLEDGTVELEKYESKGVESCDDPLALVLEWYEE